MTLISAPGQVYLSTGGATNPDVTLAGPEDAVVGLLLGRIGRAEALSRGVTATGNVRGLSGLRPRGERRPDSIASRPEPQRGSRERRRANGLKREATIHHAVETHETSNGAVISITLIAHRFRALFVVTIAVRSETLARYGRSVVRRRDSPSSSGARVGAHPHVTTTPSRW
jgi:hypothetical protein